MEHPNQIICFKYITVDIIKMKDYSFICRSKYPSNPTEAIKAIDIIRTSAGLPAYSGASTESALIGELLNQEDILLVRKPRS